MNRFLAVIVCLITGIIILLGYFLPFESLSTLRSLLLDWSVTLAGTAGLIGCLFLIRHHFRSVMQVKKNWFFSLIILFSFLFTVAVGFLFGGPANDHFNQIILSVQIPLESSILAVFCFILLYMCMKLMSQRKGLMGITFIISVILFLLLNSGLLAIFGRVPFMDQILGTLHALPVAGMRGILISIAIGSIVAALRVLLTIDKPYSR